MPRSPAKQSRVSCRAELLEVSGKENERHIQTFAFFLSLHAENALFITDGRHVRRISAISTGCPCEGFFHEIFIGEDVFLPCPVPKQSPARIPNREWTWARSFGRTNACPSREKFLDQSRKGLSLKVRPAKRKTLSPFLGSLTSIVWFLSSFFLFCYGHLLDFRAAASICGRAKTMMVF